MFLSDGLKLGNYATEKHKLDCLAVSIKRSCPLILIEFAGGIQTHQVGKAYQGRKKLNKMYKEVLLEPEFIIELDGKATFDNFESKKTNEYKLQTHVEIKFPEISEQAQDVAKKMGK
ncbi:hypothetical protein VTP01DRAFT_5588 [Rhizomucor pusillus]|uniref:uncharacterized protein n=1 Tax=Rhizomucor pusillus TaxID=4840 RepID=UPI0037425CDE